MEHNRWLTNQDEMHTVILREISHIAFAVTEYRKNNNNVNEVKLSLAHIHNFQLGRKKERKTF